MDYAYARVSSVTQNEERQVKDFEALGIDIKNIYIDKQSGKDFNRKHYKLLMKKIKKGDTIFIKSIDRLGRNYEMIIEEWKKITKDKGVFIVVLDMPLLDTRTRINGLLGVFVSDLVLQILSFVAENERTMIKKRQAEGIAIAKAKGVKFGRDSAILPDNFKEICNAFNNKEISLSDACRQVNLSKSCFYKYRKIYSPKQPEKLKESYLLLPSICY